MQQQNQACSEKLSPHCALNRRFSAIQTLKAMAESRQINLISSYRGRAWCASSEAQKNAASRVSQRSVQRPLSTDPYHVHHLVLLEFGRICVFDVIKIRTFFKPIFGG